MRRSSFGSIPNGTKEYINTITHETPSDSYKRRAMAKNVINQLSKNNSNINTPRGDINIDTGAALNIDGSIETNSTVEIQSSANQNIRVDG